MWTQRSSPSPEYIEQIGQRTLAAIQRGRPVFRFWRDPTAELRSELTNFIAALTEVDPQNFTEDQFAFLGRLLGLIVRGLEHQLIQFDVQRDAADCQFFSTALKQIRVAKQWIAQGYSPSPDKRPTDAELDALTNECAAAALDALSRTV